MQDLSRTAKMISPQLCPKEHSVGLFIVMNLIRQIKAIL